MFHVEPNATLRAHTKARIYAVGVDSHEDRRVYRELRKPTSAGFQTRRIAHVAILSAVFRHTALLSPRPSSIPGQWSHVSRETKPPLSLRKPMPLSIRDPV